MSEDSISRQVAINTLRRKLDKNAKGDIASFYNTIIRQDIECIEQLPSAEPKRGEWIDVDPHGVSGLVFKCSKCEKINLRETNFCPNCGADMREE